LRKDGHDVSVRGDFTDDVTACVKKRSRAIKYRGAKMRFDRVKELEVGIDAGARRVDLEISHRIQGSLISVRLVAWGDRWVWVDARKGGKSGWVWFKTIEGRFIGPNGAQDLMRRLEATLDVSHQQDPQAHIEEIWSSCLAQGPKRL
jgi:hypothetical protein